MKAKAIDYPVFACAGVLFPRGQWIDVPVGFEAEAVNNPFLEIEPVPAPVAPVAPAAPVEPVEPVKPVELVQDLSDMTVQELRAMADAKGLSWSGLKKAELIDLLLDGEV